MKQKNAKGITLVALIITIIILLILAGISIASLTQSGLFGKAQEAKQKTENAQLQENETLSEYEQWITNYIGESSSTNEGTGGTESNVSAEGNWNSSKEVNEPQLMEGMTGVYWDESGEETTVTAANQDKWYDYSSNKWANAKTEDGSYWVWIPRYAYQIASNCNTSTAGTINIKFLKGTSDEDSTGTTISKDYPTVTGNAMKDYVVHPAFTDGTANNFENGEWDAEIPGFWVAKYAAGYQANTTSASDATQIVNSKETVVYSDKYYTSNSYTTNALSQNLSDYTNEKLSYPVFKPLTYAYNCISIGDIFTISKEISKANSFYGLNTNKTDSHQMKNSEWGAVAYLTQSSYGRNGTEVTINSKNVGNGSKYIYAITGYAGTTANGVAASSTNNMSGVFDLSGCVWEYTAGFISNGNSNLASYGKSILDETEVTYSGTTVTKGTGNSTEYATIYPYNTTSDSYTNNYNELKKIATKRFGDGILETSTSGSGSTSWYSDYSYFPGSSSPFFGRGGNFADGASAGSFAFSDSFGNSDNGCGFRAVLVGV